MKKNQAIVTTAKLFTLALAMFFLSSCSTEEDLIAPTSTSVAEEETVASDEGGSEIESFTVSGIYTDVTETTDCATCTYIVPANATLVDGKELGFAPGSVICLDKTIKYKSLEFTNLEGTSESPITISYCSK
jgi:hypothetical protein